MRHACVIFAIDSNSSIMLTCDIDRLARGDAIVHWLSASGRGRRFEGQISCNDSNSYRMRVVTVCGVSCARKQ